MNLMTRFPKFRSVQSRLLLSRVLTRSGDQAWEFAVPIVLLRLFPDRIQIASFYFFLIRIFHVFVFPSVAALIDRMNRSKIAKLGIFLQATGVAVGAVAVTALSAKVPILDLREIVLFSVLVAGGFVSNIGGSLMDVAIANDLVPAALTASELAPFNSHLRQLDLATEVLSPIVAGTILLIQVPAFTLLGFWIVAGWNLTSFVPELLILRSLFRERSDLNVKSETVVPRIKRGLWENLSGGWRQFFEEPVALAVVAYALLWLSVLSPHGVLLTGYLKDGWRLPEWAIGSFRGLGALFGLAATFLYPRVVQRLGLRRGSQAFLMFQAAAVTLSLICFFASGLAAQVGFLALILLSRVGLYGFSLGEMQIRQVGISAERRGVVNGLANAVTSIATIGLYGAGALFGKTEDFKWLVVGSVVAVLVSTLAFSLWLKQRPNDLVGTG